MNNKFNSLSTRRGDVSYPTQCTNPANTSYHNLKNWLETKHSNPTQTSLHLLTPDTTSVIPPLQHISHKPLSLGAPSACSIPLLGTQVIFMEELCYHLKSLSSPLARLHFLPLPSQLPHMQLLSHFLGTSLRAAPLALLWRLLSPSPGLPVSADLA